jgi:ferric-dicitrate binding protein FerR (iron transport regulator)
MTRKWGPGPIAWIVLRAAGLVPAPICYRLEEEWLADLWALDGPLQRTLFAFGCVWAALQMRGERITVFPSQTAHRNIFAEPPAVKARTGLRIPFFKRRDRRHEQASTWLARLQRGLRADEGAQLQAWLKRRSHRKCIARVAAQNDGPEDLTVLAEICELKCEWLETRHGRSPIISAAAVLISIGIVSVPFLHLVLPQKSFIETLGTAYTSDRHTLRHVGLPDGTQMVLNRGTRIAVWYYDEFRGAMLVRGEASFTVRHEASRTFLLDAGGRHFGTEGATFNVRLTGQAIELTVLDGVVGLSAPLVSESRTAHVGVAPPTLVKAGQTIDVTSDRQSTRSLSQRETQARVAWQRG